MLDKFHLKNFRAFEEAEITIGPITVIVGPNNSGKSSLIQAILLIQQTLLRNPNNYTFNLNTADSSGEQTIDAGSFTEIINNNLENQDQIDFKLYFTDTKVEFSLKEDEKNNIYINNFLCNTGEFQYSLKNLSMHDYDITDFNINNIAKFSIDLDQYFMNTNITQLEINPRIYREGFFFYISSATPALDSLMNYYSIKKSEQDIQEKSEILIKSEVTIAKIINDMVKSIDQYNRLARLSYNVYQEIRKDFLNIKYIGPIRKIAERSYSIAEVVKDIGFCGEHAAQILALRDERLLQNKVEKWFQQLDVADKMQIYIRDKTQQGSFELKIKTRNSKLGVNYRDVGCGTSQILPIIVQSLMAKDESLVILEQPEAHLHPKAQAELADFFIKTASENKRFLIETHSDYLIERLRYYVANKQLRPEDLFIYYVGQNPTSASAEVSRIQISSDGQYLNLPDDYITKFRFIEMQNITKKTLQNLKEKENKYMKK